jgi:hypothetical protein
MMYLSIIGIHAFSVAANDVSGRDFEGGTTTGNPGQESERYN